MATFLSWQAAVSFMLGIRRASVAAVVLAVAGILVLAAYGMGFVGEHSGRTVLLPAGTTLVLVPNHPLLNVSFWIVVNGTRLVGAWASDQPAGPLLQPYGEPFLGSLPHFLIGSCGGSAELPLSPGHYALMFIPGSSNVTRFRVMQSFALTPANGAPPTAGPTLPCSGSVS